MATLSYSQTYYSQGSSAFDNLANWNDASDGTGSNPTLTNMTNGASDFIIQSGDAITEASRALTIRNLIVESTGSFDPGGFNFSIMGTTTLDGSYRDTNSAGTNLFSGLFLVNASGAFTSTHGTHEFRGGITNSGQIDTGGNSICLFTINFQSVVSNANITLGGQVDFFINVTFAESPNVVQLSSSSDVNISSGVTVINRLQTGHLSIRGNGLTIDGSLINDTNAYLKIWPDSPEGNLIATADGNTVDYFRAGGQTVIATDYYHLKINSSGLSNLQKGFDGPNVNISGDLELGGADVTWAGTTVNLGGDFTGNGGSIITSGPDHLYLNGTSSQTINLTNFSPFEVGELTLENAAGVIILSDLFINGGNLNVSNAATLRSTLEVDGNIVLDENLTIDGGLLIKALDSQFQGGPFSSSNMVQIQNGGFVRTLDPNADPITYPIGTNGAYTPITVTASFTAGASPYIEASVTASEEPNVLISGSSLSKYWTVNSSDMTVNSATVSMTYDDTEINGDEGAYLPAYYSSSWSTGSTSDVTEGSNTAVFSHGAVAALDGAYTAGQSRSFSRPFITTWTTTDGQVTIPASGTYDITWMNLTNPGINEGFASPTGSYTITGLENNSIYQIEITGGLTRIAFSNGGDKTKILTIEQWGSIAWTTFLDAFYGCTNLTYNATDNPNLSGVTSFDSMFQGCTVFDGNIGSWITTTITNMSAMFFAASNFNQDLGGWDVQNVLNMDDMFTHSSFNQDISAWDVSKVTTMQRTFRNTPFNNGGQPLMWGARTAAMTNINRAFQDATSFNVPISDWDVSGVSNFSQLFNGATDFNQDLSAWTIRTNTTINMSSMFSGASSFDRSLAAWDISGVTNMTSMLDNSGLSVLNYDATLIGWATLDAGETQIPLGITLGAAGLAYCYSETERASLQAGPNNWTINDGGADCPEGPPGNTGIYLDGTNDYVEALGTQGVLNFAGTATYTIESWIKITGTLSGENHIISKFEHAGPSTWRVYVEGDGTLTTYRNVNPGLFILSAPNPLPSNEWIHVAVTYDGTTAKIYVNGTEEVSSAMGSQVLGGPAQNVTIGAAWTSGGPTGFFPGQIDEVQIWDIARSESQIRLDMIDNAPSDANLVGYWSFDDDLTSGNQTLVTDGSGNGYDATLMNEALWAYRVTNADDSGTGSLREAINQANTDTDTDFIDFNIPTSDPNYNLDGGSGNEQWTIQPVTNLPNITESTILDATTQPGSGNYNIKIDGQGPLNAGLNIKKTAEVYGFEITGFNANSSAGGVHIFHIGTTPSIIGDVGKGNVINGCRNGVYILSSNNNVVKANLIGTDTSGTMAIPNSTGIFIGTSASPTTVGGALAGEGNLISGNSGSGIGTNASGNYLIEGNLIGTDITGVLPLPNGSGIGLGTGSGCTIRNNTISGNTNAGISLNTHSNSFFYGNNIGVGSDGVTAVANNIGITTVGVSGSGADDNVIGGTAAGQSNIIAYNTSIGIELISAVHQGLRFIGNEMYCNGTGIDLKGAGNNNIQPPVISEITSTTVGGSGVIGEEIHVYRDNSGCAPSDPQGQEYLGTTTVDGSGNWQVTGLSITPGSDVISATASNGTDGTSEFTGHDPFIVTNTLDDGIGSLRQCIANANASPLKETITFNLPGVGPWQIDLLSTITIDNPTDVGMLIDGLTQSGSSFGGDMVTLSGGMFSGTSFFISEPDVEIYGLHIRDFDSNGIEFSTGSDNATLGAPGRGNVISGSSAVGVYFESPGGLIQGNRIGTSVDGLSADGNGTYGIWMQNAHGTQIGGNGIAGEGNLISANGGAGQYSIRVRPSDNVIIQGNLIGTDANGDSNLGNAGGISIEENCDNAIIGGANAGEGNVISGCTSNAAIQATTFAAAGNEGLTIENNLIGLNLSGTTAIPNANRGISVRIGSGTSPDYVIRGNTVAATSVPMELTNLVGNVLIDGNKLGADVNGNTGTGLDNTGNGIRITNSHGANTTDQRIQITDNIIINSTGQGIELVNSGAGVFDVLIYGNSIGADASGNPAPNGASGIRIGTDAYNLEIGGVGNENILANNTDAGLLFNGLAAEPAGSVIGVNEYFCNGTDGIDFTLTPTVNAPIITNVSAGGLSGTSSAGVIDLYQVDAGCADNQGAIYLAQVTASSGTWSYSSAIDPTMSYVATLTDASSGISEFSVAATGGLAPNDPSNLAITNTRYGLGTPSIELTWADNSSDETDFEIERAEDASFTTNVQVLTIGGANAGATASFTDNTVTDGVLYYYRVRSTNGTTSGNSNVVSGVPVVEAGKAASFDNSNEYISIPPSIQKRTEWTFSAWFKDEGSTIGTIYSEGAPAALFTIYKFAQSGGLQIGVYNQGSWYYAYSSAIIPNEWNFLAVSLTGATDAGGDAIVLLNNEVRYGEMRVLNHPSSVPAAAIGRNTGSIGGGQPRQEWVGEIDEISTWSRALNEAEMRALRDRGIEPGDPDLISLWHFDEPTSSSALIDHSGNENHGTRSNNPSQVISGALHPFAPVLRVIPSDGLAEIQWDPAFEHDFQQYDVEYKLRSDGAYTTMSVSNQTTSNTVISGLVNDELYDFRISVSDEVNQKGPYQEVVEVPTVHAGNAAIFDGLNSTISAQDNGIFTRDGGLTLEAWIKPEDLNNTTQFLVGVPDAFGLRINAANEIEMFTNDGTETSARDPSGLLNQDVWSHVSMTLNGTVSNLYLNGLLIAQNNAMNLPQNSSIGFHFGAANASSYFTGQIDEVRLWDNEVDQSTLQSNMFIPLRGDETNVGTFSANLVALWHFDEPSGNLTAYSSPSNSYDGTLTGNTDFVLSTAMLPGGVITQDYDALIGLYNSTDGENWFDNTEWLSLNPVSSWFGVTTTGNRVTGLDLDANQSYVPLADHVYFLN